MLTPTPHFRSGWSFLKPFLSPKEKKVIFAVLLLQVVDNIAILFISSSSEGTQGYVTWTNVLHLVDIACCCAVMFPIIWQIRRLEEAVAADEVRDDPKRTIQIHNFTHPSTPPHPLPSSPPPRSSSPRAPSAN